MNALDLCIYMYQVLILLKLIITVVLSFILFVWSIVLVSDHLDQPTVLTILIGTIVGAMLSITFTIKTVFFGVHGFLIEFPRCFLLAWAIYSTWATYATYAAIHESMPSSLVVLIIMLYVVALSNLLIMRFPYGEDGEIRV